MSRTLIIARKYALKLSKNSSEMHSRSVIMGTFWQTGIHHHIAQQPTVWFMCTGILYNIFSFVLRAHRKLLSPILHTRTDMYNIK